MKPYAPRRALALLAILIAPFLTHAQSAKKSGEHSDLKIEYVPESRKPRSFGPQTVTIRFSGVDPGGIIEGRLRLNYKDAGKDLLTYETPELAITSGATSYRFLIPSTMSGSFRPSTKVHCSFITEKRVIDLGALDTPLANKQGRTFVIAASVPEFAEYGNLQEVINVLRIERFDPNLSKRDQNSRAESVAARIKTDEFGTNPLTYCEYDITLLAGVGFTSLGEKQLNALAKWVKAGGACMIVASGTIDPSQLLFLNELSDHAFTQTAEGALRTKKSAPPATHHRFNPGLGRLVVAIEPSRERIVIKDPEWTRSAAFLYGFRSNQLKHLQNNPHWNEALEYGSGSKKREDLGAISMMQEWSKRTTGKLHIQPIPGDAAGKIGLSLIPRDTKLLPGYIIFIILLCFVLAIGPLDYMLLGKIRKRKYTWILFPLTSIFFTLIMVKLAEKYMGTNDHRNSIRIVDVSPSGEVLRQNRLSLIFAGQHRTITEAGNNALICKVTEEGLNNFGGSHMVYEDNISTSTTKGPSNYRGRLPGNYEMIHDVRQWTPVMIREMQLGPTEESLPSLFPINEYPDINTLLDTFQEFVTDSTSTVHLIRPGPGADLSWGEMDDLDKNVLVLLKDRIRLGFFSVISRVSPHGGATFEDLNIIDTTSSGQTMIAVVTHTNEETIIYRCLIKE